MIAQLGERQTEDLKVPGSIPGRGSFFFIFGHTNTKFISVLDYRSEGPWFEPELRHNYFFFPFGSDNAFLIHL